jgi:hypothetical protein
MTNTEAAIQALFAKILAKSQVVSPKIPKPLRNEGLPTEFSPPANGVRQYLNLWDGEHEVDAELLGADVLSAGYDLVHKSPLEYAVAGKDQATRDAAFSDGLIAIDDAIKADRTLGGVVSHCAIEQVNGQGSGLTTDGLPNIKGAELIIRMEFTSDRPF